MFTALRSSVHPWPFWASIACDLKSYHCFPGCIERSRTARLLWAGYHKSVGREQVARRRQIATICRSKPTSRGVTTAKPPYLQAHDQAWEMFHHNFGGLYRKQKFRGEKRRKRVPARHHFSQQFQRTNPTTLRVQVQCRFPFTWCGVGILCPLVHAYAKKRGSQASLTGLEQFQGRRRSGRMLCSTARQIYARKRGQEHEPMCTVAYGSSRSPRAVRFVKTSLPLPRGVIYSRHSGTA